MRAPQTSAITVTVELPYESLSAENIRSYWNDHAGDTFLETVEVWPDDPEQWALRNLDLLTHEQREELDEYGYFVLEHADLPNHQHCGVCLVRVL